MHLRSVFEVLFLVGIAHGFSAPRPTTRAGSCNLSASKSNELFHEVAKMFGAFAVGASLTFQAPPASAESTVLSSSMQLSEVIKTLDMSLPTYGDISASQGANLDSLKNAPTGGAPAPVKSKKAKDDGDGMNMGSILPSMNKKGPAQKKEKAKKEMVVKEKEEKIKEKIKIVDMDLPSYEGSTAVKEKNPFGI